MATFTNPLPNPITTTHLNRVLAAARAGGAAEGAVDHEIAVDQGVDLDPDVAEECLGESETFGLITDAEVRAAYREAYLSAWEGAL